MAITTMPNKEFGQHVSAAMKASRKGPVFITELGKPAYVLLSIDDYQKLSSSRMSLAEALCDFASLDEYQAQEIRRAIKEAGRGEFDSDSCVADHRRVHGLVQGARVTSAPCSA